MMDCSSEVKDLDVTFERVLSQRQHVSYSSKTNRFHFRNTCRIRKCHPYQFIGNVKTGLFLCFVLWTPQTYCFLVASGASKLTNGSTRETGYILV